MNHHLNHLPSRNFKKNGQRNKLNTIIANPPQKTNPVRESKKQKNKTRERRNNYFLFYCFLPPATPASAWRAGAFLLFCLDNCLLKNYNLVRRKILYFYD